MNTIALLPSLASTKRKTWIPKSAANCTPATASSTQASLGSASMQAKSSESLGGREETKKADGPQKRGAGSKILKTKKIRIKSLRSSALFPVFLRAGKRVSTQKLDRQGIFSPLCTFLFFVFRKRNCSMKRLHDAWQLSIIPPCPSSPILLRAAAPCRSPSLNYLPARPRKCRVSSRSHSGGRRRTR